MSNFNNEHHTYLIQCGGWVLQISLLWVLDAQVEPEGRSLGELSGSMIVDRRRWWVLVVLALRASVCSVVGRCTHFRSSVRENASVSNCFYVELVSGRKNPSHWLIASPVKSENSCKIKTCTRTEYFATTEDLFGLQKRQVTETRRGFLGFPISRLP